MMKNIFILIITGLVFSLAGAPPVTFKNSKHAWKILNKNKFAISRRSAYIYLTGIDSEREKAWHAALVSNDPVLRRDAVSNIFRTKGEEWERPISWRRQYSPQAPPWESCRI